MDVSTRQNEILGLIDRHGSVDVDELVTRYGLSAQTIRNDLRDLDTRGLVRRTHGGARLRPSVANRAYAERRQLNSAAKAEIARAAARLIPDNCSVALNIGTTTEHVADALMSHEGLVVLSNNINIINRMAGTNCRDLILVGGTVRPSDGAIVGEDAVEFIARYKVDYAIIGASSLDPDGAILDFDAREVAVARALLRNARQTILVCDSSKFATAAPIRICDIADLDYMVTDRPLPAPFQTAASSGQTQLISAKDPS